MIELVYPWLLLLAPLPVIMRFMRADSRSEEAALEAPLCRSLATTRRHLCIGVSR